MTELTVALTDYSLTLFATFFAVYFIKNLKKTTGSQLWIAYFLFVAISSFLGGTTHGFASYLNGALYTCLWFSTLFCLGITISFGWCLFGYYLHWHRRTIACSFVFLLIPYTALIIIYPIFIVPNAFYMLLLISFLTLSVVRLLQTGNTSWCLLALGWLLFIVAGLIQYFQVEIDPVYWNHNTIYHIISLLSLTITFISAKNLALEFKDNNYVKQDIMKS